MKIENISEETLDDLAGFCIPPDQKENPLSVEGRKTKKDWAARALKTYGTFAKLAHIDTTFAGIIQYVPTDEQTVEIQCIFVPEKQNQRKGVATALLNALIRDVNSFGFSPLALVTYAFEVPGWYPQNEFYLKRGFKKAGEDPYLLYYPLQEGYIYTRREFIPQEEDKGKILIFYDPSCPFCTYFNSVIKKSLKEITDIPIQMVNKFEEPGEVKKRGNVPFCVVNKKPIESFFTDKEKFQSEVKKALEE